MRWQGDGMTMAAGSVGFSGTRAPASERKSSCRRPAAAELQNAIGLAIIKIGKKSGGGSNNFNFFLKPQQPTGDTVTTSCQLAIVTAAGLPLAVTTEACIELL